MSEDPHHAGDSAVPDCSALSAFSAIQYSHPRTQEASHVLGHSARELQARLLELLDQLLRNPGKLDAAVPIPCVALRCVAFRFVAAPMRFPDPRGGTERNVSLASAQAW